MFHDWNVREGDFGVWKLWNEIKETRAYKCIEIASGHGLGIATKSINEPGWHVELKDELEALKAKGCLLERIDLEREERKRLELEQDEYRLKNERMEREYNSLKRHIVELEKAYEHKSQSIAVKAIRKLKKGLKLSQDQKRDTSN